MLQFKNLKFLNFTICTVATLI
uniref:Uncharacterized protein n=1 Tax=Arundo donax TaxID=35708 RepID=A0A0A8ZW73_ARUDO